MKLFLLIVLWTQGQPSIRLAWDASTTADIGYRVYRSESPTFGPGLTTPLNQALVSVTSYTDLNVVPGHTYYYKVTAVNSIDLKLESTPTNTVSTTIPNEPPPIVVTIKSDYSYPVAGGF